MEKVNIIGKGVRVVRKDGLLFTSLSDLAVVLGMSGNRITSKIPEEYTRIFTVITGGGKQPLKMVNSRGLMYLLYRSKKKNAPRVIEEFIEILGSEQ